MTTRGRPRKSAIDESLLTAAIALIGERGYVAVTVDELVERAGTSKPAFYRRYRDLADLVPRILESRHGLDADIDTGSLRGDLAEVQRRQVALFTDPVVASALIGWAAHVQGHPDQARPFVESYLAPRRAFTRVILARAVARGEIDEGADPELIADLLTGPLLMRIVLPGMPPIDARLAAQTVDAALATLAARRPALPGGDLSLRRKDRADESS